MKQLKLVITTFLIANFIFLKAQKPQDTLVNSGYQSFKNSNSNIKDRTLELMNDSLFGFNIEDETNYLLAQGLTKVELEYYLPILKREYIKSKYKLTKSTLTESNIITNKITASFCLNEDFENSSPSSPFLVPSTNTITTSNGINGWYGDKATTSGTLASCNLTACCTGTPSSIFIIAPGTSGLIDPKIGSSYPIFSVFGNNPNNGSSVNSFSCSGDFFAKINDEFVGLTIHRLSKSFTVTPSNSLIKFAYMAVVQVAHCCCDNGGVLIRMKDCSNNLLPTPQFSASPPQSSLCPGGANNCISAGNPISLTTATTTGWYYSKWALSSIDLSPYIGNCVTAEVIAFDCPYGAHAGYAYFDAECDSMNIKSNSNKIGANTNSVVINGCANVTNTITAPIGFAPYNWQGPAGFTTSTLQTITTNIPGTYTLTMGGFASYAPTIKYISLNHGTIPITISSSNTLICQGDSVTLSAIGANTYSWSTGSNLSSITITPSVTTTYTVNGDYSGCPGIATITQSVTICTGINSLFSHIDAITLAPNPNNGSFNLDIAKPIQNGEIEIRNILGQVVMREEIKQGSNKINSQNLLKGIYTYAVLQNKEVIHIGKVIIE